MPLSKRTLIIITALALPVVALAVFKPSARHEDKKLLSETALKPVTPGGLSNEPVILPPLETNATNPATSGSPDMPTVPDQPVARNFTLKEMHDRVQDRLDKLNKMTDAQWEEERKTAPNRPATLAEAKQRNQKRLLELENMTQEQWEKEQAKRPPKTWETLSAQEKLQIIDAQQEKLDRLREQLKMESSGAALPAPVTPPVTPPGADE